MQSFQIVLMKELDKKCIKVINPKKMRNTSTYVTNIMNEKY